MALQKTWTNSQGVDGNYWRIVKASLDRDEYKCCNVSLALFKDAAAASAGNDPLHTEDYWWNDDTTDGQIDDYSGHFDAATLDTVNYNLHERIYEKLKTVSSPIDFTTGTVDV